MRGNHLFGIFNPEKLKKVIFPGAGNHLFENAEKPPHLGSFLDPWSKVRGNHLFELFRAENAEKVIFPHLGSSWSFGAGNHLFELFRAENAEKVISPHLLSGPLDHAGESPF